MKLFDLLGDLSLDHGVVLDGTRYNDPMRASQDQSSYRLLREVKKIDIGNNGRDFIITTGTPIRR